MVTSTETLVRNGTICDFFSKADVIQKQRRPEWPIDANRGTVEWHYSSSDSSHNFILRGHQFRGYVTHEIQIPTVSNWV